MLGPACVAVVVGIQFVRRQNRFLLVVEAAVTGCCYRSLFKKFIGCFEVVDAESLNIFVTLTLCPFFFTTPHDSLKLCRCVTTYDTGGRCFPHLKKRSGERRRRISGEMEDNLEREEVLVYGGPKLSKLISQ